MPDKPILRPLDFQPVTYQEQQMWFLRDPLQLSDMQLIVPAHLAQMLMFCDGTRTVEEVHNAFCRLVAADVDLAVTHEALAQLDSAYLLDNERSQKAMADMLASYRAKSERPPTLAGLSYPADPEELASLLNGYSNGDDLNGWRPWRGRGIISPHIDYQRGGPVYAKVWQRAKAAVLDAEMVIIFGTDHNGSAGSFTLTRQPYATPFGRLPTDEKIIDRLAEAIGPDGAFAEELHHRNEHSVELSAVWLHHICQQENVAPPPMIPILCGSFHHFVMNGSHPAEDERLQAALEVLRSETKNKRILAVASVDLAHVGPNFGDDFRMDDERRSRLKESDAGLIAAVLNGNAGDFYAQISAVQDRNRICGFSSIYLMLRFLEQARGVEVAYDHCTADPQDTSLVSICGLLLE